MSQTLSDAARALLLPAGALTPGIQDEYERPAAELVRPASDVEGRPLASLVGIPFDTSIMGRRGAKSGPAAVRWGLNAALLYEPNLDVDMADAPKVADYGDIDVMHTDVDVTWQRVTEVIQELVQLEVPLVAIGGDHGLAFPIIRGVTQAVNGPVGVISVDAHLDARISHHGEKSSGVPFRYMLEQLSDSISGHNFTEFGIGGWLNTRVYADYLRDRGTRLITQAEVHRGDYAALVAEAIDRAANGTDVIYMTFDIDAIDGAVAGGTNVPCVGGLSAWQALELVWAFARHPKAIGMDVMEVSPQWDSSTMTERMAAALVLNFLAGRYVASQGQTTSA